LESIKNRVSELDKDGKKLIYLVPEQFTFQADKNLVYTLGERGIHKVQVLSFTRMAHVVFSEVGGITKLHMNSAGKNMLLYKVLEEVKEDLQVFKRASKQQGFVNVMSETISELKRYAVTEEALKKTSDKVEDNQALKEKLQDISRIYERFNTYLHKSHIDAEDALVMLAEKLDKCTVFNGAEIWVDEFSTFTPLQYNVLGKLFRCAERVNITLTTDCLTKGEEADKEDIFMLVKKTENNILRVARENNIAYEEPICLDEETEFRFKESKELSHLEKYYYHSPINPYEEKPKHIKLFKGLNIYSEIQSTAREIIRLCRDEKLRFNNVAVIARDLGNYEKLIDAIFSEYEIPYFIDKRRDINSNPLVILINSVMEVFTRNWSYEAVFRYLKTGLVDIEREEIDLIENYVLENGIRGRKWLEEKWESNKEEDMLTIINDIKSRIVVPLLKLQDTVKGKRTIREVCTGIYEFLNEIHAGEKVEQWVEAFKKENELDRANEYSQVWNVVIELLDQLVEVLGEEKVKLEEFIKILSTGINEYDVGVIPASLDQVLVGSIERVKSHEVTALFIIGVNDGVFPKVSAEEGILNDRDRGILKGLGLEIASDTKAQAFEEQFLIYRALTIGGRYLRLSYPIADFEGKTKRASMIVSRINKLFPKLREESDIIKTGKAEEALDHIVGEDSTFNELIAAVREEDQEINPVWWDAFKWYMSKDKWRERAQRAFAGLSYNNQVETVNSAKIKKLYGMPLQLSVSRLERYASCPFAYYVQYGLKAAERKEYEFTMPELGTFVHEVLDKFSEDLGRENMTFREVTEDYAEKAISQIVEEKVNERSGYILNSSPRYRYMANRLKNILTKSVNVITEQVKRSSFNPIGYEISFGNRGDYPPIDIELPGGDKVELIGRIDRVDELETEEGNYIRVIDYKSGNKSFKLADVYYGLQLQLLVYLDAILSNKEEYIKKGYIPGAILYFKLDDPIVKVEDEEDEEKIEKTILKELKMRGLLLKDAKIIRAMDNSITDNRGGNSLIIPAQIIGDNEVGNNTSGATIEEFELLRKYVRKVVSNLCEEMLEGNISINPYKKDKNTPCQNCSFQGICQFDTSVKENKYKYLADKKAEEVWELMRKEVEKGGKA
jgi:ATP-dependent helicase/nuclease subunit B